MPCRYRRLSALPVAPLSPPWSARRSLTIPFPSSAFWDPLSSASIEGIQKRKEWFNCTLMSPLSTGRVSGCVSPPGSLSLFSLSAVACQPVSRLYHPQRSTILSPCLNHGLICSTSASKSISCLQENRRWIFSSRPGEADGMSSTTLQDRPSDFRRLTAQADS